MFFPNIDLVHLFDWDEINFAESAREMLVTNNYWQVQIDYKPFWEKPPLFIWMQALSMKFFGVGEYGARFPNAVCGLITILVLYLIGKRLYDREFAVIWVMAYVGSLLPHFYFKSGIIDPWFNLFIFLSIYFLSLLANDEEFLNKKKAKRLRFRYVLLSGLFAGLAILTKGPVAILLIGLTLLVFFLWNRAKKIISIFEIIVGMIVILIVTFFWYGFETIENGPFFIKRFIEYQIRLFQTEDAGHGGPFYYHFIVLLIGCFPASFFALKAVFTRAEDKVLAIDFKKWMMALLFVVLLIFSIVKTKILHYSSLAYFPLTFLAAQTIWNWSKDKVSLRLVFKLALGFVLILLSTAMIALPIVAGDKEFLFAIISEKDLFARASIERGIVWADWEATYGLLILLAWSSVFVLWHFGKRYAGSFVLFATTVIYIQTSLYAFAPRIEEYAQGPAIEFYEQFQGTDTEVRVLGFKSYAHLFYTRKMPGNLDDKLTEESYLKGELDAPVYFVSKVDRIEKYSDVDDLEELYRKGGFVFLVRYP